MCVCVCVCMIQCNVMEACFEKFIHAVRACTKRSQFHTHANALTVTHARYLSLN